MSALLPRVLASTLARPRCLRNCAHTVIRWDGRDPECLRGFKFTLVPPTPLVVWDRILQ
jgi:hypothetical protein